MNMRVNQIALAALCTISQPAWSEYYTHKCTRETPGNCLNGVGPAVTNPDNLRVVSNQFARQSSAATKEEDENMSTAFFGHSVMRGLSSGDMSSEGWGVWGTISHTNFDADIPINSAVQPVASYDANTDSTFIGLDRLISDNLVLGVALGYESTDIDTDYNGGNNESDGLTGIVYGAYVFNDNWSIDAAAGYSDLEYDTRRIDNVFGGTIRGNFDSNRSFATVHLNYLRVTGPWVFGAKAGYLYTQEDQDGYTETGPNTARTVRDRDIDLTQFSAGVEVARTIQSFEPFVTLTYVEDLSQEDGTKAGGLPGAVGATQPDDDNEMQLNLGIRYYTDNISASLEYGSVHGRDTFDSDTLSLTLRADW